MMSTKPPLGAVPAFFTSRHELPRGGGPAGRGGEGEETDASDERKGAVGDERGDGHRRAPLGKGWFAISPKACPLPGARAAAWSEGAVGEFRRESA